ncbi:hypothetical protein [Chlamydia felis Fe/C-56]|uniref:Uncharacterized protein n=1 Tax=Chlamydia felis (strain Fe/C-56) TaxID=264202 RepID=Q253Y3_CHLFF|nr:hypothetical protein [Chlamydia felis Fe/C-56]
MRNGIVRESRLTLPYRIGLRNPRMFETKGDSVESRGLNFSITKESLFAVNTVILCSQRDCVFGVKVKNCIKK